MHILFNSIIIQMIKFRRMKKEKKKINCSSIWGSWVVCGSLDISMILLVSF